LVVAAPATADSKGFIEAELNYGYFYGTFNQTPNVAVFAGGRIEEFCIGDGEPGTAPLRVFLRNDGTVDLKVNDKDQPIYLYHTGSNDIMDWLGEICGGFIEVPVPFATGEADLKVRITEVSKGFAEIFNSVNGKATGTDGTEYKVRGTADFIVEGGPPLGLPEDFIDLKVKKIRR
jgi:hypothetical protein